jgi:peptidoglycan-associated lipoprotein
MDEEGTMRTVARNNRMLLALTCLTIAAALATSGCSGKRKGLFGRGGDEEIGGAAGAGIGEEGLAGQSSITQFEEGGGVVQGGGIYRDVQFNYDSFQLDSGGMEAVRHNASVLQSDGARRVEIEGHCDERGASEYNLALGAKRARAVKDALVGMGISGDRLDTVSYGEELPLCRDASETCYAMNRRAHLVDR